MPKGPQGQNRPADAIGNGVHIARIATSEMQQWLGGGESTSGQYDARGPQGDHQEGRIGSVGLMATFAATRTIADLWGEPITNLSLQKLLFLSHMIHLGRDRGRLATNTFQAWDYGPVEPQLYHKLKAYGSNTIPVGVLPAEPYGKNTDEYASIVEVIDALKGASPRKLVSITHWKDGAWANSYQPGVRGLRIPDADILSEFNSRLQREEAN